MSLFGPRRLLLALPLAATTLLPGGAVADTSVTYTDAGQAIFQFDVPDFWTLRVGGPRALDDPEFDGERVVHRLFGLTPSAGDDMWSGLLSPRGVRSFDDGVAYLEEVGPFLVKNAETTRRRDLTINGLRAKSFSGHGRRDGRAVHYTAVLIALPSGRFVVSVTVIGAGADANLTKDVDAMLASVRGR